jgi:hypothetical protein
MAKDYITTSVLKQPHSRCGIERIDDRQQNHRKQKRHGRKTDAGLEEILEAEAAAGNQAAVKMAADMFTDVNMLIELFQLADPKNKLVILLSIDIGLSSCFFI